MLEDGARRLTQSGAILTYLAAKHGAYGGGTDDEQLEVLRWLLFDNHKFTSYFGTYRFIKSFGPAAPDPAVMAWLQGRIDNAYGIVDRHLRAQRSSWVGTDDRRLLAVGLPVLSGRGERLRRGAQFPNIAAWLERLSELPGWASPYDVLPGERIAPKW